MSYLNLKENLFLGKEELSVFQNFSNDNFYKILGFLTKTYGITGNADLLTTTNNSFLVTNAGNLQISINNPSYAFAYPNNLITWDKDENISISNTFLNKKCWVKISYEESIIEKGTVVLNSNGQITGNNTKFLSRLRGEPNFSSKVALYSYSLGVYTKEREYIVESVTNDTLAKVYSYTGIGTAGTYYYAVVGTFSEGEILLEEDKFPFRYDSCKVQIIEETSLNTPPDEANMKISNTSFYIARLTINSVGNVVVEDKRNIFESTGAAYSKWWSLK